MVSIYIGNTDNEWFDFLSQQPDVREINFWRPSPKRFNVLAEGELFAFRLKAPRNKIGGFGIFSASSILPINLAWDAFGPMNGVPTQHELVRAISQYRQSEQIASSSFICCRVLVEPIFLPEHLWIDLPASWAINIVGGKRFDASTPEGSHLWDSLIGLRDSLTATSQAGFSEAPARYGGPTIIWPRLGQGAFRVAVTEAYRGQCALTEGRVLPALEAAHIRPYAEGGSHEKTNGILLRKDIHSVFDSGYATIDEKHRFVVSSKVKDVFQNGSEYRRLHGQQISMPRSIRDWPAADSLRWHNEERFLG